VESSLDGLSIFICAERVSGGTSVRGDVRGMLYVRGGVRGMVCVGHGVYVVPRAAPRRKREYYS